MRLRCHCDGNWLFLIHLFVDLYCVYLYWLCIIIHTQVPLSCYVVYDIAINMMDVLRRCCWAKIVCLCSFYVQSVRNNPNNNNNNNNNNNKKPVTNTFTWCNVTIIIALLREVSWFKYKWSNPFILIKSLKYHSESVLIYYCLDLETNKKYLITLITFKANLYK